MCHVQLTAPHRGPDEEQIKILSERITSLLGQVEALGCEGRVDEAQNMMKLCDKLSYERAELQAVSHLAFKKIHAHYLVAGKQTIIARQLIQITWC